MHFTPRAKGHTTRSTHSDGPCWPPAQNVRVPPPTNRHAQLYAPKAHQASNMKTAKKADARLRRCQLLQLPV